MPPGRSATGTHRAANHVLWKVAKMVQGVEISCQLTPDLQSSLNCANRLPSSTPQSSTSGNHDPEVTSSMFNSWTEIEFKKENEVVVFGQGKILVSGRTQTGLRKWSVGEGPDCVFQILSLVRLWDCWSGGKWRKRQAVINTRWQLPGRAANLACLQGRHEPRRAFNSASEGATCGRLVMNERGPGATPKAVPKV